MSWYCIGYSTVSDPAGIKREQSIKKLVNPHFSRVEIVRNLKDKYPPHKHRNVEEKK